MPGVGACKQRGQVAVALPCPGIGDLGRHELVVAIPRHLTEHSDGGVREVRRVQPGQRERVGRICQAGVVHEQRSLVGALGNVYRLQRAVTAEPQARGVAGAEPDQLAVLEPDQPLVPRLGLLERRERVVVEDRAVLVDLYKGRALVVGRGL